MSAYSDDAWEGMARSTDSQVENLLLEEWLPAAPEVKRKLEEGAAVADVGCGRGAVLIKLAEAFPNSRYVGYDAFEPMIARATATAAAAEVADRVSFRHLDASKGLAEQYDVIMTFDVVHDAVDPRGLLRAIRQALRPGGSYLMLENNCSDKIQDNAGPVATRRYGQSILYCLPTSLAGGGAGLGSDGLPESKVRELCAEAGFGSVRLPWKSAFSVLYEIQAR